jgi:hypothetical protein
MDLEEQRRRRVETYERRDELRKQFKQRSKEKKERGDE